MKYRLFLFGLFFLINPYIWIIDILPDFIGLLLMAKAINPLCDISPSAEAASNGFKKAAAVSIAQIGFLIPMISLVNSDPTFNMIFSFCFNILRIIFLVPAFHELFNSLIYFSERHAAVGKSVSVGKLKVTKLIFQAYIIAHCVLSAFPEIVYFRVDDSGFAENIYPLANFRVGVIFLSALIILAVGVVWYTVSCLLFKGVIKNQSFNAGIISDIASAPRSEKKRIMRSVTPGLMCATLSLFSTVAYFIDGKSIIPPYFAPILHIAAIGCLNRVIDKKVTRAFSIVSTVLSFPLVLFYETFSTEWHTRATFDFKGVKNMFAFPFVTDIVYSIFLAVSAICLGIALTRLIRQHTGLFWESAYVTHNSKAAKEKLRAEQLSVLLTVLLVCLIGFNLGAYGNLYQRPLMNLHALLFGGALSFFGTLLISSVKSSVIEKYSTENKMN